MVRAVAEIISVHQLVRRIILLGLLTGWCFLYLFRGSDQPVVLFGRSFSDRETLLGLVVVSFVAFFFTSVASLIISGLLVDGAIVAAHGAFRMPEDLFLDDADATSGNSDGAGSPLLPRGTRI
ncbi:hypothetical protein GUJ93_ZPchr0007g5701 [Zizania palustris]|uniref:PRA1 family protein n=1 Tax=Zizania palustris TaxID=103762 RepID=A0A8J5TAI2_ZIZPA|nr:hypothetical protein GUJ93_ZPchr0007g5701 [Zizania palustris]